MPETLKSQTPVMTSGAALLRPTLPSIVGAFAIMVVFSLPLSGWLIHGNSLSAEAGRELVYWALELLLVAYVVLVEKRPLSSIGLKRPTWMSLVFGFVGVLLMVGGMAFIYLVIFPALRLSANEAATASVMALPFWFRVFVILRAAVFEEMFFRGFIIERLTEITRGYRLAAAVLSCALFTLLHLGYWGWAHLMVAGFGGVVLTALYLWRRDLSANMIAHLLTDAVGFLLG